MKKLVILVIGATLFSVLNCINSTPQALTKEIISNTNVTYSKNGLITIKYFIGDRINGEFR